MIILWCDGENVILTEVYAACHIEQGAVVVKVFRLGMMTVTVQAEQQARKIVDVIIEYLRYVVVKLLGVGRCMHAHHGAVEVERIGRAFRLHEVEVRHRTGVVILDGIGVEADELYLSGDEAEVGIAVDGLIGLVARAQAVVVAQQYHRRHLEFQHSFSCPLHFAGSAEVGDVAAVDYEVDAVLASVDIIYGIHEVVVPLMAVADHGKPDGILALHRLLYLLYVLGIQIGFALYANIVRVNIEYGIAARKEQGGDTDK